MIFIALYTTTPAVAMFEIHPAIDLVVKGSRTVLTCQTGGNQVTFAVQYLDSHECEIVSGQAYTTLPKCNQTRYTVGAHEHRPNGYVRPLVVDPTSMEDAATYKCIYVSDPKQRSEATLTVLGEKFSRSSC